MKTTLDIPDDLFRDAKVKAAKEGLRFKDLVQEGLRHVISSGVFHKRTRRVKFPLILGKKSGPSLTDEQVRRAEQEEEKELVKEYAKLVRR